MAKSGPSVVLRISRRAKGPACSSTNLEGRCGFGPGICRRSARRSCSCCLPAVRRSGGPTLCPLVRILLAGAGGAWGRRSPSHPAGGWVGIKGSRRGGLWIVWTAAMLVEISCGSPRSACGAIRGQAVQELASLHSSAAPSTAPGAGPQAIPRLSTGRGRVVHRSGMARKNLVLLTR